MPNNPTVVSSVPVQSTLPVVGYLIAASNLPILGNKIASNNPTVALPNSIPVPIGQPVPINPPSQRDRDVLTKLPKSLLFDGCINWLLFRRKFERYARMQDWSDEECGACLGWCLTGKAVDFYALLTEGRETLPYAELMQRLQERFGAKELPATAQGRFQVAQQEVGESLDDWSDRVLTLATTAFRDLPYAYATEQAVTKFCHGLLDKEAAKHVSLQLPTSMGDAMNMMKIYSHVQLACATAPRDSQESERVSRCVHEVRRAPSPDTVIGSAVDKLTLVVDRLLGSVGQLSDSCGSQDDDSRVRQPVQVFRSDEDEVCMASMQPKVPMKRAPRTGGSTSNATLGVTRVQVAAVHVGIGTYMPTKGDPAQMLTKGAAPVTGETTGTVVGTKIQMSAPRDRSEAGMVQIGASIPGWRGGTYRACLVIWNISGVIVVWAPGPLPTMSQYRCQLPRRRSSRVDRK
ncbi:hypothetical protein DPMN_138779 [Dreissena polymorpha]|uniref:Retrotransposon gag domain-containing protein n=1 Tax=Dreissena polymorpha TaxID=45954 RepID=A0A9D4G543_DREPO|nr:hypothetical protein DPMN_138779 [Dreissena polymorpha]